jgi:hypothetical protein
MALARNPFCERHKRWMKSHTSSLTPESSGQLIAAIQKDSLAELTNPEAPATQAPTLATVYFVPDATESDVYLTLAMPSHVQNAPALELLSQVRLVPGEILFLKAVGTFPGLADPLTTS